MRIEQDKLTTNQQNLLLLIFKFRYITTDLIAKHRHVTNWSINTTLKLLLDKELIARKYDNSYKLLGRGARYFLTTKGAKYIAKELDYADTAKRLRGRDSDRSDDFIDKHLHIFELYTDIRSKYPNIYKILTKYEADESDNCPDSPPDLYVQPKKPDASRSYFIDFFDKEPFFVIKDRIAQYIAHYDQSGIVKEKYPRVILIFSKLSMQKRVQNYTDSLFEDIEFILTGTNDVISRLK